MPPRDQVRQAPHLGLTLTERAPGMTRARQGNNMANQEQPDVAETQAEDRGQVSAEWAEPPSIRFLGATGTVTGSRYLVTAGADRVLVDCGLFQGPRELRERNWEPIPNAAETVSAVVLTHAHLDHSGYLPRLVRNGWSGQVFCTDATADLCRLLLPDSGYLQEKDADHANRRRSSRHHPALPLYSEDDAWSALEHFSPVSSDDTVDLSDGIQFRFRRAGHILGASFVELSALGVKITFSGDLGRYGDAVMRDPEVPGPTDYLVVESTYGDRLHEKVDPQELLGSMVERCVARGGTVIIPAFAVGRAQTLLFHVSQLKAAGRLANVPVYLDSPMAIDASEIMCSHSGEHRLSDQQCRAACGGARYIREVEESKALSRDPRPKIIVSASGMATGGRVVHHLMQYAPDPRNLVLFAGYQAAGTRGAAMVGGAPTIRIYGETIPVRAEVASLPMLSGHADADEIIRWLHGFPQPPRMTFVTHGEPASSEALRQRIADELGWPCKVPLHAQKVFLP